MKATRLSRRRVSNGPIVLSQDVCTQTPTQCWSLGLVVLSAMFVWSMGGVAWAAPQTKTWTDQKDFAQNSGAKNVTWTDVPGQIQIVKNPPKSKQTPFLYVPNSASNTVSQLDTKTGKVNWTFQLDSITSQTGVRRGRGNPSRTTVDANGHVWVGLRGTKAGESYVVVQLSMQGKLMKVVRTGNLPRAIAIDLQGNVWVGNWASSSVVKIDGRSGKILKTIPNVACPYGAVVDVNNNVWVANNCRWNNSNTLTKLDTNGNVLGRYPAPGAYGIATDQRGQVWVANWPGQCVHRFNNSGKNLGCVPLNANPRGIAVDGKGNVWIPCSHVGRGETKLVVRLSGTGQITGRFTDVGRHSIGAAVDADGYIWVISYRENMAAKIRATDGKTVGKHYTGGSGPYTYSDMTGFAFQSLANPAQGYWRAVHSSQCRARWNALSWKGQTPPGTSIGVRARSAASQAALAKAKWSAPLTNGAKPNIPDNKWIEIEVALRTQDGQITPAVTEVTLTSTPTGVEICNGLDDDCDGLVDNVPGTNKPLTKPCKTACGAGVRPCKAGDWGICSARYPVPEWCNGIDDNCNNKIDEGASCRGNSICYKGACSKACISGECPKNFRCEVVNGKKYCIATQVCDQALKDTCKQQGKTCFNGQCVGLCVGVQCPQGHSCDRGRCVKNDCYNANFPCPAGQVCQQGKCVKHPCDGVKCTGTQVCRDGNCIGTCAGVTCNANESCRGGKCVADPCANVQCAPGKSCSAGQCVDDPCNKVGCRAGLLCVRGQCMDNPCRTVKCGVGQVCRPPNGDCFDAPASGESTGPIEFGPSPDGGTIPGVDAGTSEQSSHPNTKDTVVGGQPDNGGGTSGPRRRDGGCFCSTSSNRPFSPMFFLLLVLFLGLRIRHTVRRH